jgi:hypothetical protein
MRERLEKLPVAERFKELQLLLKKEKDFSAKKEMQEWLIHVEKQLRVLEEWHASGFARVEAMEVAQELPTLFNFSEAEQIANLTTDGENLENLLATIPTTTPSLGNEATIKYGPSAEYVPSAMYGSAADYSTDQSPFNQDSVHSLILGEQRSSVQQREREAQERQASASEKTSLETKDFVEYKAPKSRNH